MTAPTEAELRAALVPFDDYKLFEAAVDELLQLRADVERLKREAKQAARTDRASMDLLRRGWLEEAARVADTEAAAFASVDASGKPRRPEYVSRERWAGASDIATMIRALAAPAEPVVVEPHMSEPGRNHSPGLPFISHGDAHPVVEPEPLNHDAHCGAHDGKRCNCSKDLTRWYLCRHDILKRTCPECSQPYDAMTEGPRGAGDAQARGREERHAGPNGVNAGSTPAEPIPPAHSPTPWKTQRERSGLIEDADGNCVGNTYRWQDAALVVKAVNQYAALGPMIPGDKVDGRWLTAEELEQVRPAIDTLLDEAGDPVRANEDGMSGIDMSQLCRKAALAALAILESRGRP